MNRRLNNVLAEFSLFVNCTLSILFKTYCMNIMSVKHGDHVCQAWRSWLSSMEIMCVTTSIREWCESRDSEYTNSLTKMSLGNRINSYVLHKLVFHFFIVYVCT